MNGKKIIRIAGTSYSGSTMLDLMLANGEECFSCGEIYALFRPYRKHHFNPVCGCGNPNCPIWSKIKSHGESELWCILPEMFPDKNVFIDSSKELVWLHDQTASRLPDGMKAVNVLIWKTPLEFALSCWKRGVLDNWYKSYTRYHERYFSIMKQWNSVRYSELASDPSGKLKSLCDVIDIPYFPGKEEYWRRVHHTLFGSDSAKLHLYDKNDSTYKSIIETRTQHKEMVTVEDTDEVRHHKKIYSVDKNQFDALPDQVRKYAEEDEKLLEIHEALKNTEIDNISADREVYYNVSNILLPRKGWYLGGKVKRLIRSVVCKVT